MTVVQDQPLERPKVPNREVGVRARGVRRPRAARVGGDCDANVGLLYEREKKRMLLSFEYANK